MKLETNPIDFDHFYTFSYEATLQDNKIIFSMKFTKKLIIEFHIKKLLVLHVGSFMEFSVIGL